MSYQRKNKVKKTGSTPQNQVFGRLLSLWVILWRGLRVSRPDLIICKSDPPMLLLVGRLLGWWHACPVVYWCQDIYPDILRAVDVPNLLHRPVRMGLNVLAWWHGFLMRGTALRVVPAASMRSALTRHDGKAATCPPIKVQPNWPEPSLKPAPWPETVTLTILYSGHYGYGHDMTDFIAVARLLDRDGQNPSVRFRVCLSTRGFARWQKRHGHERLPTNLSVEPLASDEALLEHLADAHLHAVAIDDRVSQALAPSKATAAMRLGRPIMLFGGVDSSLRADIDRAGLGFYVPTGQSELAVNWLERWRLSPLSLATYRDAVLMFDQQQQDAATPDHMADLVLAAMPATPASVSGSPRQTHHHLVPDQGWEGRDAG